jgi:hypothetical protein
MEREYLGKEPNNEFIKEQSQYPKRSEHNEFQGSVGQVASIEYPMDTEQIIDHQSDYKSNGGGDEVIHPRYLC